MDTHEELPMKVTYELLNGGTSTAYLDTKLAEGKYSGTNKHTDEKVVVFWSDDNDKWLEGFETMEELQAWIREELIRDYQRDQLENVIGPAIYGDRDDFVVYQDADRDWQIRPSDGYIAAEVRGIFNMVGVEEQKEEK
jgi:hypothetical protein